jgi:hypothetical protein
MLGIYIPTHKRPESIKRVAKNIEEATKSEYKLYFGLEPYDTEGIKAAEATGHSVMVNKYEPSFSNTIQTIYEQTNEPIFLPANDDFLFLDGWDTAPLKMLEDFPDIMVLGVHDGNPNTSFSAIQIIRRQYIKEQSGVVDMPNRVYYPYNHNFVDTEMTETARARKVWDRCDAPCIEHQHPSFKWLGEFEPDETYQKNDASAGKDSETYHNRKHLW